jgi:hypothetical protein
LKRAVLLAFAERMLEVRLVYRFSGSHLRLPKKIEATAQPAKAESIVIDGKLSFADRYRHCFYFVLRGAQTREEEVIFFYILRPKQSFFSPEVTVCGMLVSLNQQQGWGQNAFRLNELPSRSDRLIFTAFNAVLRDCL